MCVYENDDSLNPLGWEPSNYVSSRSARNERKEARPEDYMDEEDLEVKKIKKNLYIHTEIY